MRKLICVADWAADTYTTQEFQTAYEGYALEASKVRVSFVSSTPSTIHTGYIVHQMMTTEVRYGRPHETVIFQSTDPRQQSSIGVTDAKGGPFFILKMVNGMHICGPNAGHNFSFLKKYIDRAFIYPGMDTGSQLRSRDLYARICAHLADYMEDELDLQEMYLTEIADFENDVSYIGHIDSYGNIKTTLTHAHLKGSYEYGDAISVMINDVKHRATYRAALFGGHPGELSLYPGSSGHPDDPYLEISVWRHFDDDSGPTGLALFGNPKPGMRVELGDA